MPLPTDMRVICDSRNGKYLVRLNVAQTRNGGVVMQYDFGHWRNAMGIPSERAQCVATALWPFDAVQPNPYSVEDYVEADGHERAAV